jgi:hypothetical protein
VQIISTSHSPSTLFSNLTQIDLGGEVQRLAVSENSAVALLSTSLIYNDILSIVIEEWVLSGDRFFGLTAASPQGTVQ